MVVNYQDECSVGSRHSFFRPINMHLGTLPQLFPLGTSWESLEFCRAVSIEYG